MEPESIKVCTTCCRAVERLLLDTSTYSRPRWVHKDDHTRLCKGAIVAEQAELPLNEDGGKS